jgi:formyl-CoA transferase
MLLAHEGADVIKVEAPGDGELYPGPHGAIAPGTLVPPVPEPQPAERRPELEDGGDARCSAALWPKPMYSLPALPGDTPGRLGLGYDQLRMVKPDIVYCQATGLGAQGPHACIPPMAA